MFSHRGRIARISLTAIVVAILGCAAIANLPAQQPAASVAPTSSKYIPADVSVFVMVDWNKLINETKLGDQIDQLSASLPEIAEMKNQHNVDLRRSIRNLSVGIAGAGEQYTAVIQGSINLEKWTTFMASKDNTQVDQRDVNGTMVYQVTETKGVSYFTAPAPGIIVISNTYEMMNKAVTTGAGGGAQSVLAGGPIAQGLTRVESSGVVWVVADMTKYVPPNSGMPIGIVASYIPIQGLWAAMFFGSEAEARAIQEQVQAQLQALAPMAGMYLGGDQTLTQALQESKVAPVGSEVHLMIPLTIDRLIAVGEKAAESAVAYIMRPNTSGAPGGQATPPPPTGQPQPPAGSPQPPQG